MRTDYKFWYIKRDDDALITEVGVRFYEGEITSEMEPGLKDEPTPITRYRRTSRLNKDTLGYLADKEFTKEYNDNDCVVFTNKDFGPIKSEEELKNFLNSQLALDKNREPIDEQIDAKYNSIS